MLSGIHPRAKDQNSRRALWGTEARLLICFMSGTLDTILVVSTAPLRIKVNTKKRGKKMVALPQDGQTSKTRRDLLAKLLKYRGRLPLGFVFDREEANQG